MGYKVKPKEDIFYCGKWYKPGETLPPSYEPKTKEAKAKPKKEESEVIDV